MRRSLTPSSDLVTAGRFVAPLTRASKEVRTAVDDQAAELIDGSQALGPEARAALDQMVARLFEHWCLTASDQAALLGQAAAPEDRPGVRAAVASNESSERIGHLLAIHAKLRTLFPHNRDIAYSWMSMENSKFNGQTPVAVVREHGPEGLRMVREYLDRAIGA